MRFFCVRLDGAVISLGVTFDIIFGHLKNKEDSIFFGKAQLVMAISDYDANLFK